MIHQINGRASTRAKTFEPRAKDEHLTPLGEMCSSHIFVCLTSDSELPGHVQVERPTDRSTVA